MSIEKPYQPSPEEIKKEAEEIMTERQKELSILREEKFKEYEEIEGIPIEVLNKCQLKNLRVGSGNPVEGIIDGHKIRCTKDKNQSQQPGEQGQPVDVMCIIDGVTVWDNGNEELYRKAVLIAKIQEDFERKIDVKNAQITLNGLLNIVEPVKVSSDEN